MKSELPKSELTELARHIVFRELPFSGVLLDTRTFAVHRLSPRATTVLRQALYGSSARSPYGSLFDAGDSATDSAPDDEFAQQLLAALESRGVVRR